MNSDAILQAIVSGVLLGCLYALVSVGLALVFGVMQIINFAHGNLIMVGMYVSYFTWYYMHLDPVLTIPIAAIVMALMAAVLHLVIIRPALKGPQLSQIVVTFGLLIMLQGGAQLLFSSNPRTIANPWMAGMKLEIGGVILGGPQLAAAVGAIVGLGGLYLVMSRTKIGAAVEAVSQDSDAASLQGIRPERIRLITWVFVGLLIGLASALLVNFYPVHPESGFTLGLVAFVVVSLAGFGSLLGTAGAAISIGLVQTLSGLASPQYSVAAIFAFYLVAMAIRPNGLFAGR